MKKNFNAIGWALLILSLVLLILGIASTANLVLILLALSLLVFIASIRIDRSKLNLLGLIISSLLFLGMVVLYWFYLNMR